MKIVVQIEHRASSSRSKHEGESSFGLCDRLSRTRDNSQRQLPTDQDYAVSTREYQTDQSSLKTAPTAARSVLGKRRNQRQQQIHRLRRLTRSLHIRPYHVSRINLRAIRKMGASGCVSPLGSQPGGRAHDSSRNADLAVLISFLALLLINYRRKTCSTPLRRKFAIQMRRRLSSLRKRQCTGQAYRCWRRAFRLRERERRREWSHRTRDCCKSIGRPKKQGAGRETPRASVWVSRLFQAVKSLGRNDLKPFTDWNDGQPATELNFKFYRQATNKIVARQRNSSRSSSEQRCRLHPRCDPDYKCAQKRRRLRD
jgi:hypothetical protein